MDSLLSQRSTEQLHYSAVLGIGFTDFEALREILLKGISEIQAKVSTSSSQRLCGLGMDLFPIGGK